MFRAIRALPRDSTTSALAWNNFRIFNFYDSERYMARAAIHFWGLLETVEKKRKPAATLEPAG
jgi:hypothetical protein